MFGISFSLFAAAVNCQKGSEFFGMVPWYHYLDNSHFYTDPTDTVHEICGIKKFTLLQGLGQNSDIPLVLLAVVDDLLRLAGIIAVVFVLIGALKYVASQGSPDSISSAQNTVINALIGLAITIVAIGFVSFLGSQLGG